MEPNEVTNVVENGENADELSSPYGTKNGEEPDVSSDFSTLRVEVEDYPTMWIWCSPIEDRYEVELIERPSDWPKPYGFVYGVVDPNDSPKGLSDEEAMETLSIVALIKDEGEGWAESGDDFDPELCSVCDGNWFDSRLEDDPHSYGVVLMTNQELLNYVQERMATGTAEPSQGEVKELDLCCRNCGGVEAELQAYGLME